MITWLVGENSFEIREALKAIEADFSGISEKADGATLALADLPNLLMGVSLFTPERLVIIDDITKNSVVWEKMSDWLPRISDEIHVVFIDTKPDKRTTSYKALKAAANLQEFANWTDKETYKAEQWVSTRATEQNLKLSNPLISHLVARVGLDPWQLAHALDTLALLDEVTQQTIDEIIPPNPTENIFQLFETALDGKTQRLSELLKTLQLQEDPYATFALLSSQAMTLAAVTYAPEGAEPTKEFGIHPFVAQKLTSQGKKLGKAKVGHVLESFAKTDADLKRSKAEPWLLIERTLLEIAQ